MVDEAPSTLVPVELGNQRLYLSVRSLDAVHLGDEREIAARRPRLGHALDALAAFGKEFIGRFEGMDVSKVTVEFGCEIALESGSFVAVIGKASASSAIAVSLEWSRPDSSLSKS